MKKARPRYWSSFFLLFVLLALLVVWNINAGSVSLSGAEILRILFSPSDGSTEFGIVRTLRLPRICAAVILGSSREPGPREQSGKTVKVKTCQTLCMLHEGCG